MNDVIILNDNLLINEGASRKCYRHPLDSTKCLKVAKNNSAVNEQDLQAYQRVQTLLRNHIAGYEDRLADTNLGKALVCELIRDDEGNPSASFAEYRRSNDSVEENLASQFAHFFDKISRENLFFYDLNPKKLHHPANIRRHPVDLYGLKESRKNKNPCGTGKNSFFC